MSINQLINAAPMVLPYGTEDNSTKVLPRLQENIPQHLPKFYLFTKKGPTTPQLVVGSERDLIFGSESFDLRSKYANHSTVFANLVNAEGNTQMIQRVIPEDAGPEANLTLWLDVLHTTVDIYARNPDGSIQKDISGAPIVSTTAQGYKVKWTTSYRVTKEELALIGQATPKPGTQTDPNTSTQSVAYPILEKKVASQGGYGNDLGIRLYAPTTKTSTSMPTKMMAASKAYPYLISVIERASALSAPIVHRTLTGEQNVMFTLLKGVIDPLTDSQLYAGDVIINAYQNITDPGYALANGPFSDLYIYNDNIEQLTTLFHTAEIPFVNSFTDFTAAPADKYLFNIVSGVSSNGVPYNSFVIVDAEDSVRLTSSTNIYAKGGSDGTMSNAVHAQLVKAQLDRYLDPADPVQEIAVNVESVFYDTGFPLETKYALCGVIANRKDTFPILATHTTGEATLTVSEEQSIAIALRTRLQMYPESDYFGTPVMRGMVVNHSGKLRNSQYTGRLPLTAEIAIKSARYMGAGNGKWKNGANFDAAPGSILDYMFDVNVNSSASASVRNKNWDIGLVWVQPYDRRSYFFPALKTVYDNDTSVLNSYLTALAICELNKVAAAAWREFSGVSHLTNLQLAQQVNQYVIDHTRNRFDDRFVIIPDTTFTDMDLLRGFSWTLPIKIYAPNMKTVMTTYIPAYRLDELKTQ